LFKHIYLEKHNEIPKRNPDIRITTDFPNRDNSEKIINYFKQQAKFLLRDVKSETPLIDKILQSFIQNQEDFSLMKAQHNIAQSVGFLKWTDLLKASIPELELAVLLFNSRNKISVTHWKEYISGLEQEIGISLDPQSRLEIFQHDYEVTFNKGTYDKPFSDNRLNQIFGITNTNTQQKQKSIHIKDTQITSLPLEKQDRIEFIKEADKVFESIIWRVEPHNREQARKLWNAEEFIDNLLTNEMLPISKNYALSIVEAFMIQEVLALATQADQMAN